MRRLTAVAVVVLLALGLFTGSNAAAESAHTTTTAEYGKEGPAASGLGAGCYIAWQSELKDLYLLSDEKVYVLNRPTPGTVSPLPSIGLSGVNTSCGDRHLAVDNSSTSSKGNVYVVPSTTAIYGFTTAGTALSGFPVDAGGETCGVATTNDGQVWGGQYGGGAIARFKADGTELADLEPGLGSNCKIAIDNSNNDLYVISYGGAGIWKLSAADGYTNPVKLIEQAPANAGVAINGVAHRIYVPNGSTVLSYDTNDGTLKETIEFGGSTNSVAVDEATDTLFISDESNGVIREMPAVLIPTATTGDPIGNSTVSGTVDPDGGGEVVDCYFEFGLDEGGPPQYTDQVACSQATPITSPTPVSADLPGLEGEKTYNYRLVASNSAPGGTSHGSNKQITPHNVKALTTETATDIDRQSARLHGSFEGTGEDTKFFFEYEPVTAGTPSAFDSKTPIQDAGVTSGPTDVFADLTGVLAAGVTYRYRVVGQNTKGISRAAPLEFTTLPAVHDLVTLPATEVDTRSARLNGSLDAEGLPTTYYFEWGKTTAYGQATPLPPGTPVGDVSPGSKGVSFELPDLEPGTTYNYRIAAVNSYGVSFGGNQTLTTQQTPSITSVSATNVTATTADLIATINPNGSDTTYYFEYGRTPEYDTRVPIPDGGPLTGTSVKEVVVSISGLEETTYHFRVVATSKWGTVTSEDQTFDFKAPTGCPNHRLRQQTGAAYLPDCRAYELASAAQAGGAAIFAQGPSSPYAEGRLAYAGSITTIPGSGEPQNVDLEVKDLYVATRKPDGWVTRYVGVPGSKGLGSSSAPGGEYGGDLSFSNQGEEYPNAAIADRTLSHFVIWDRRHKTFLNQLPPPLEGTNAPDVYDFEGNVLDKLPTNFYEVPGANVDMRDEGWTGSARINPDYTHYFFSSVKTAFTADGLTAAPGSVYDNELETGTVKLISKTEEGDDIPADTGSGYTGEFLRIPAVSDDGSHVLISSAAPPRITFAPPPPFNAHLYMAVKRGDGTYDHYDISLDKNSKNVGVHFESMTSDGSRVYFTTEKQMTPTDTDTSIDLYVWDEETNSITRVSDSGNLPGNSDGCTADWTVYQPWSQMGGSFEEAKCNVQVVPPTKIPPFSNHTKRFDFPMARDSGDIYFYSPEQLDGARGTPESRNLYVYRNGRVRFVASLNPNQPVERINVSPDGQMMALITKTRLTAYDNVGRSEMYLYDAATESIKCVSCLPSGEAPSDDVKGSMDGAFMTFDGRAFWSTGDALVPQDANEGIDVYEFVDGRAQLISPGTGDNDGSTNQPVGLVGVSGSGVDVFFSTFETLVPQDDNGAVYKFYDARTNGGIPFVAPKPPCAAADECHGADSSAPPLPEVGTGADQGNSGNVSSHSRRARAKKRCKKVSGLKKKRCRAGGHGQKRGRNG